MNSAILNFAYQELSEDGLRKQDWIEIVQDLNIIFHSHRHKKQEEFTEGLDFSIIRECLESVSVNARDRLLNNRFFAILFVHFQKHGSAKFLKLRQEETNSIKYSEALKTELDKLVLQAQNTISQH